MHLGRRDGTGTFICNECYRMIKYLDPMRFYTLPVFFLLVFSFDA
jgi:hypothetical protein